MTRPGTITVIGCAGVLAFVAVWQIVAWLGKGWLW